MFPETIATESLELRPLSPAHVDVFDLYDLFGADRERSEGVFEYVPMEPMTTVKDAHDWLETARQEWEDREYAKYAVYEGEELVGTTALNVSWERRGAELSVLLGRPYWGRGYAGECSHALAAVAFERLDLALLTLGYDEGNERSRRAIEKVVDALGGQRDGVSRRATVRDGELVDAHSYSITREEYRESTGE